MSSWKSGAYWEHRYAKGGSPGRGSSGIMNDYKVGVVLDFIKQHKVQSVLDLGCGNGMFAKQLPPTLNYVGVDISQSAVEQASMVAPFEFYQTKDHRGYWRQYDMTLSLEVVFHLIEDASFVSHLNRLFYLSRRFVVIYSSNHDEITHVRWTRHRRFSDWIEIHKPDWKLLKKIDNAHPYDGQSGSFSDFYFYERKSYGRDKKQT